MLCILAVCLMGVVAALNGCSSRPSENGSSSNEASTAAPEKLHMSIVAKGWQHQFWQAVKTGAYQAAEDYDVDITFVGPEGDYAFNQQVVMIEEQIETAPDAIIIAASNFDAVIPVLEKATDLGIPIIAFDSGVEVDLPVTTVMTDNHAAAALAADKMAEAIGNKGQVGIICHDEYSMTGKYRKEGFVDRIHEAYPGIDVVSVQFGSGQHELSEKLVREMIQTYPDLKGIFGANEGSAIGLINGVVAENAQDRLVIIGFDAGSQIKEAIRRGIMYGAVSQKPVQIGYKAVEAAYKYNKGENLDKNIYTGHFWYDKSNVDDGALQGDLYD